MRKLNYTINLTHFKEIREYIVPALFTKHQFDLIEKKNSNKKLTNSEKNEFSRAISKKMNAINKIMEKETGNAFIYAKDKIKKQRLNMAIAYLKRFSRKFKNKHIIISGSFLYKDRYKDIDIFIVSKYEKEDYKEGKFHINYLVESVYYSLFFASLNKLCISNRKLEYYDIKENINIDTLISLYQELFNDLDRNFKGVRAILREFLLQAAFVGKKPIPDSAELRVHLDSILKSKKPKEIIKKTFVDSIILGVSPKTALAAMKDMINSYNYIIEEYKQHKEYYLDLMEAFKDVVSIES